MLTRTSQRSSLKSMQGQNRSMLTYVDPNQSEQVNILVNAALISTSELYTTSASVFTDTTLA
jgi:hypothetical protein